MRHKWGEHLRSYLDWDWDSGGCLQRFFSIERSAKTIPTEAALYADLDMDNGEGETLDVYIGAIQAESFKTVRVAYHTSSGEMKYRTFSADSSIGGLHSNPVFFWEILLLELQTALNNGQYFENAAMVNYKREGGQNWIAYDFARNRIYKCTIMADEAKRGGEMTGDSIQSTGITAGKDVECDASLPKGATSHPYVHLLNTGATWRWLIA